MIWGDVEKLETGDITLKYDEPRSFDGGFLCHFKMKNERYVYDSTKYLIENGIVGALNCI